MKNKSLLALTLLSSSLAAGCAWIPWNQGSDSTPSTELRARVVSKVREHDGTESAIAFHALGRHLQREGRWDEAERAFGRALDFDPSYAEARNALAALAALRGDLQGAISTLSSLVTLHPEQPHLLGNLGYAYYLRGDYVLAKQKFSQALIIDPHYDAAWQKLLLVREKLGEASDEEHLGSPAMTTIAPKSDPAMSAALNPIVKLSEGVYQLTRPLRIETTKAPVAQSDLHEVHPSAISARSCVPQSLPISAGAGTEPLRLELLNGNGINRLARSVRDVLAGPHWRVVRVANHQVFSEPVTRIEYAKHRYNAARELAAKLGVAAQLRPNYQQGDTHLRVVLGRDFPTTEGLRERLAGSVPLLAEIE